MLKLFKTLIILYSTIATVSATVTPGDPIVFNPLTYDTDNDPASNYHIVRPKENENEYHKVIDKPNTDLQITKHFYADSDGTLYYKKDDGDYYDILGSKQETSITVQQVYIQKDYDYRYLYDLEYNSNSNNPEITAVKYKKNEDTYENYNIDEIQIYRQKFNNEDTNQPNLMYDDDGNPIFVKQLYSQEFNITVNNMKLTPEYNDYKIGQLVKVEGNTIQACVDNNNIKLYDLKTYIANYLVENSNNVNGGINISEDINFIVKNSYTLKDAVYFGSHNAKLFIPENITLNMSSSAGFSGGNSYEVLLFGKIEPDSTASSLFFGSSNNQIEIIMGQHGTVHAPNNYKSGIFNCGANANLIVYPGFYLNDEIFPDGTYNIYNNTDSTSYSLRGRDESSIQNPKLKSEQRTLGNGLLYLNRFTENDADKAKLLKATLNYDVSVVLPSFLKSNDRVFKGPKYISSQAFFYIDFFPNLLFLCEDPLSYGGTKVPMNADEVNNSHKYYFEDVYSTKQRYKLNSYDNVDFVQDSIGRYVLSLVKKYNATPDGDPIINQFAEYDKKFLDEYDENKEIDELVSNIEYDSDKESNINPPTNNENKYWNTDTINTLFVDKICNPYKLSENIPAELNVGLIGDNNISTTETTITLNGDNSDFSGTYTVPYNSDGNVTVNLNHENALVSINQLDNKGNIKYKNTDTDNQYVDLSSLTYNIMTNINWDVNKTRNLFCTRERKIIDTEGKERTIQVSSIVLDMKLTNNNGSFIIFKDYTESVEIITFNEDNSRYKINNSIGYFIPSHGMKIVEFKTEDSIVKIPSDLNVIFTSGDEIFPDQQTFIGVLLKKDNYLPNKRITEIKINNNTYTPEYGEETEQPKWKDTIGNQLSYDVFCTTTDDNKTKDTRDKINYMKKLDYIFNNEKAINMYYLNTTNEDGYYDEIIGDTPGEEKTKYDINQLSNKENENASENFNENMPPILNIGLVNDGDLTIVNSNTDNTKVGINGINYGIRNGESMNLFCWPNYGADNYYHGFVKEIKYSQNHEENTLDNTPIGKPYTGTLTVPNKITDVEFGFFSFIPNIKKFNSSNNNGETSDFTGNYTFKDNNVVQYYKITDDSGEFTNPEKVNKNLLLELLEVDYEENSGYYDYPTRTLDLTLNKVTVNKGATVILNNAHISIKAQQPEQEQGQGGSGN